MSRPSKTCSRSLIFASRYVEPLQHGLLAEIEPLLEQVDQAERLRPAVQPDDVHVEPIGFLELGGRQQVAHESLLVHPVGPGDDAQPDGVFVVGLVADVGDHRQLLGLHQPRDLLDHLGGRHLVGEGRDDDVAVVGLVGGAHADVAQPRAVRLDDVGPGADDFGARGEIRALDVGADLFKACSGMVDQVDAGANHLADVVGQDVGRHADRDPHCSVEQDVGESGRQRDGLPQRAVEVRGPLGRPHLDFRQQHVGIGRKPGFGVAHRGEVFGAVDRAPVALAVDQRVAVGKGLGHEHHGLVAGAVAVGVVFA